MKTFILCGGKNERMKDPKPKALQLIGGVPNLQRTLDMLDGRDVIVTVPPDKADLFSSFNVATIAGDPSREIGRFLCIVDVMDEDWNVILYGDVVYDKEDLDMIINWTPEPNCVFFGKPANKESFIGKKYRELVGLGIGNLPLFRKHVDEVASPKHKGRGIGWDVYDKNKKAFKLIATSSKTDDYDKPEELEKIRKYYEKEKK